ncbi:DoxX family protein [Kribbella sp. NBC_01505]|uniref:DoxX family protein n=1 Tax=Kribbella sp. NBC_01505 TaxID=2903580 RepID=UPI0038637E8F
MYAVLPIVSVLLALTLLLSAGGKLAGQESQLATLRRVGFPPNLAWLLATTEVAGALGLLVGLIWPPLGVLAGLGIILYFLGAIASHLRIRDWHIAPPTVLLAIAAGTLALRYITK